MRAKMTMQHAPGWLWHVRRALRRIPARMRRGTVCACAFEEYRNGPEADGAACMSDARGRVAQLQRR